MAIVNNPSDFEPISFEASLIDRSHDETFMVTPSLEEISDLCESIRQLGGDPGADAYYGPISTDYMYRESTILPRLSWREVARRQVRLEQLGYIPIAGVIGTDWQMSARQMLKYTDRGDRVYLENPNYLLGPYSAKDGRLLPGVRVYRNNCLV